eukprot:2730192-Rhodomonas_salina.2
MSKGWLSSLNMVCSGEEGSSISPRIETGRYLAPDLGIIARHDCEGEEASGRERTEEAERVRRRERSQREREGERERE